MSRMFRYYRNMSESPNANDIRYVNLYHRGQWSRIPNPDQSMNDDVHESMNQAGYTELMELSSGEYEGRMSITVWGNGCDPSRPHQKNPSEDAPGYLLDMFMGGAGAEEFAARDSVDLMDLLGRWAPVVHASIATSEMWEKNKS